MSTLEKIEKAKSLNNYWNLDNCRWSDAPAVDSMVEELTKEVELGEIYTGKVVRTTDFGAFVEITPGTDGLVHISQLADFHAHTVEDVVKVGDEVMVMVTDISPDGKIRLSRQAVLEGWTLEEARENDRPRSGGGGGRSRNRRQQKCTANK